MPVANIWGELTIYDQEDTEVYSGNLEGNVIPYVEVFGVSVMNFVPDEYDIQVNLTSQPQDWMMLDLAGTFEGCEDTLSFSKMNNFNTHYNGQANFVDGGTYTLTDIYGSLTLTGTYNLLQ